tara:strand:- start:104792 stop:105298 length:507 start_codon:yes stop_codon:yes gene_type:complete
MKTLHLLRHAKSAWSLPQLADHDRPLNKRGRRVAPQMGAALASLDLSIDRVAVSSAARAQLTVEAIAGAWPAFGALPVITAPDLYTFDAQQLVQWLRKQEDSINSLFVIAHNPALTDLVNDLTAGHSLANIPTAGYVRLCLDVEHWTRMAQGCATLQETLFPKQAGIK